MNTTAQEKLFSSLLSLPQNTHCADCNSKSPTWASIDFGVFVCLNCSGAHRALGPSVTRVRSTKLDTWQPGWSELLTIGNLDCNKYWQYQMGKAKKPTPNSSLDEIKRYVQEKYVKKRFANPAEPNPVLGLKNGGSAGKVEVAKVEKVQEKVQVAQEKAAPVKTSITHQEDLFAGFLNSPKASVAPVAQVPPVIENADPTPSNDFDLINFDEHHPAPEQQAQPQPQTPSSSTQHPLHALYNQPQPHPHHHILQHHNHYSMAAHYGHHMPVYGHYMPQQQMYQQYAAMQMPAYKF